MSHDPKLKSAMAEINFILTKYDLGGHVSLVSETDSEYLLKIDPSWSCAKLSERGVKIVAREKDFGSAQKRDEVFAATVHLLLQIGDLGLQAKFFSSEIRDHLEKLARYATHSVEIEDKNKPLLQ